KPTVLYDKMNAAAWTGGQLEIVEGMRERPEIAFGFYTFRTSMFVENGPNVTPAGGTTPVRKGAVSWSVSNDTLNGIKCLHLQTQGSRNIAFQTDGKLVGGPVAQDATVTWGFTVGCGRQVWIDSRGHTLKQTYTVIDHTGTYFLSADFKPDGTIDLDMKSKSGEKRMNLVPVSGGQAAFDAEFEPMLVDGKVGVKDKDYSTFDPVTGQIVQWHAKAGSRFTGVLNGKKCRGTTFTLTSGSSVERVYIDDKGEMLQVDFPDKSAIVQEFEPLKGPAGLSKIHIGD
ncbi:MAG TPA: hypothetical protein VMI31_08705, partial [Fimbriimonadaceae bacterium]|nr:hypothetical protein [Fimbriimonadaceae bacterium]